MAPLWLLVAVRLVGASESAKQYQLRVRTAARDAHLAALRAAADAIAARNRGDHEQAARQHALAASYQAMGDIYRGHETVFAATMTDRADWERATRRQRQLAVAADSELRRRHPDQPWLPLRSAEPELTRAAPTGDPARTPEEDREQAARQISDLLARHRRVRRQAGQRQSLEIPAEDPDYENHGPAFPSWRGPFPDAILQPPRPEIQSSPQILERAADRDLDIEAAG